jgi:hypothetical protein
VQFVLLAALALTAFLLGVAGDDGTLVHRLRTGLSTFQTSFPQPQSREPALVAVARILGPIAMLFAALGVVAALLTRELTAFRAGRRRNHVVVCGLGEKGLNIARALRREGHAVTCIDLDGGSDAALDARARGALVLAGDATQVNTLVTARIDRAAHIVCACPDDTANARIAAEAVRLAPTRRHPPSLFVHIENSELATLLEAPTLNLENVRLQFFNIYELWGRAMADVVWDSRPVGVEAPQIVVVGCTPLGRSAAVSVARRWHQATGGRTGRIRMTLVDVDATAHRLSLETRYPAIPRIVDLRAIDHRASAAIPLDLATLIDVDTGGGHVSALLCLADDAENVTLALHARQRLPESARVIVPASAWTANFAPLLLDPSTRIQAIGYSDDPESLDLLRDSGRETLARAIHDDYRRQDPSSAADLPWSTLSEDLREANRGQVDGIRRLASLWYEFVPRSDWDGPIAELPRDDVEILAEWEHERWCEERIAHGWQPGPVRAEAAKVHDLLRPWSDLPEAARDKDRDAVRNWPKILADAGFDLRRSALRDRLAELIHARHREARIAAGDNGDVPTFRPWAALDDEERALSRASSDDISRKLERVGAKVVPVFSGERPLELTADQIELLARLEHERWQQVRSGQGWTHGPVRDDHAQRHPDLVGWEQLPEARREIDREHVRAMLELLAAVGLKAVRA